MFQILVVEDDRALNQTVCTFLNGRGYEASGVLEAMDAYDEKIRNRQSEIRCGRAYRVCGR